MAGSITVSTISNDTGVFAAQNAITGIPKAWINYNGTTQTIRSSFNISSVTYNGTGDYTFNYTTAMPNANYSTVASIGSTQGTVSDFIVVTSYTTAGVRLNAFYFYDVTKTAVNYATVNVAVLSS